MNPGKNKSIAPILTDSGLILAVLLTRLFSMSRYLHKWDSVQFALALHDYDIHAHQPHPTGYPSYIALGWIARLLIDDDNRALVTVGIFSAMLLAVAVHRLGRDIAGPRAGLIAGILAVLNPLGWYFSSIALAYISGVSFATLAVWAAWSAKGKVKWLIPLLAGISSACWMPAAILVLPVCLWGFLKRNTETTAESPRHVFPGIAGFLALLAIPLLAAYLPVIADTGGLGAFISEIQSESGKHVLRFSQWMSSPLSEFIATTGAIGDFLARGLGMGRYLLLTLLIPVTGEKGCRPSRVIGLLPLGAVAFAVQHYSTDPILSSFSLVIFITVLFFLLPVPLNPEHRMRSVFFKLWIIPGFILFTLVYVNYIGIFLIFLPAFIMLISWSIDRAGEFMKLQTIRDVQPDDESGNVTAVQTKPDKRVEKLVILALAVLMAMHDIGTFIAPKDESQESLTSIYARDYYIEEVISAIQNCGADEDKLLILGGIDDYRHWTYYFPDARVVWTKYLLDYPVREDRRILVSTNHVQEKYLPRFINNMNDPGHSAAVIPMGNAEYVICFDDEFTRLLDYTAMLNRGDVTPLYSDSENEDALCYMINAGSGYELIFSEGNWLISSMSGGDESE